MGLFRDAKHFQRTIERLLYGLTALIVAILGSVYLWFILRFDLFRPSALAFIPGVYLGAVLLMMQRPVTGAKERTIRLRRGAFLALGLGALGAAGLELAQGLTRGRLVVSAGFVLMALVMALLAWSPWLRRRHERRIDDKRERFREEIVPAFSED